MAQYLAEGCTLCTEKQFGQQLTACAALGRQDSERSLNCRSLCVDAISSLAALARSSRLACQAGGSRRRNACMQGHDSRYSFACGELLEEDT